MKVLPIVIGACGEVLPSISEKMRSLGLDEYEQTRLIEKCQRGAVIGTRRLVGAHLSKSAAE